METSTAKPSQYQEAARSISRDNWTAGLIVFLLVVGSMLAAFYGIATLTVATAGVGAICLACFGGILARMLQASAQHGAMMKALERGNEGR
jgi:hypothetical protein